VLIQLTFIPPYYIVHHYKKEDGFVEEADGFNCRFSIDYLSQDIKTFNRVRITHFIQVLFLKEEVEAIKEFENQPSCMMNLS
jgi:hypothetical protein